MRRRPRAAKVLSQPWRRARAAILPCLIFAACIACVAACRATDYATAYATDRAASYTEEFVGPLAGWMNARRDFNAVGDGVVDDTDALQKALNALEIPETKHRVLYIPAGTYRISRTLHLLRLNHSSPIDIMILGEDPTRTILTWDGPTGGVMFDYGAWYARLGRLTFDGAHKAGIALQHGTEFVTHNELSDLIFKDAAVGIEGGHNDAQGIAETAVLRCKFERCTKAGVSIQNFNSLDWFLRDCLFENCALGITNSFGAGNFHVYDSLFRSSTIADASIGNTCYFSLRNNTSIGSRAFFVAGNIGAAAGITLQGNTILDPQVAPVQVGDLGPMLLLDNVIRCSMSPAVRVDPAAGFLSMGNRFTVAGPIDARKSSPRVDDRIVSAESIKTVVPMLPGAPENRNRKITELPVGASAEVIQQAIDAAAKSAGDRPVIHLPAAEYALDRTLTVPPGCDVQILGDGGGTVLRRADPNLGPVVHIVGPSRATLRDLTINCGGQGEGVVIDHCDQPGARVFFEELNIDNGKKVGLLAESIRNARVDLQDINHSGCGIGIQVKGSTSGGIGLDSPTRLVVWSGASSSNDLSYDVEDGGALIARDIWYEGKPPGFMKLTGSGIFTLNGAEVATSDPNHGGSATAIPTIDLDGFRGRLTVLTSIFAIPAEQLVLQNCGAQANALMICQSNRDGFLDNRSPAAHAAQIESMKYTPGGGATPVPDSGTADATFLRMMMAQDRNARPHASASPPAGATDMQLYRVSVVNASVCIRISP